MAIKCKAKISAQLFPTKGQEGDNPYRVYGCLLISSEEPVELNKYNNFTITGDLNYLQLGREYELEIKVDENAKYSGSYKVVSCPTLENLDVENLTEEEAIEIMESFTTPKQAKEMITKYPKFISMVLNNEEDKVDVNNLYNIKEYRLNFYVTEIKEKYKYFHILKTNKEFDLSIAECKLLEKSYKTIEAIKEEISKNPYHILINVCNRSFEDSDGVILEVYPHLKDSDERAEFLMLYILKKNEYDGNTKINAKDMAVYCHDIAPELTKKLKDVAMNSELVYYDSETNDIAIGATYVSECFIADTIKRLVNNPIKLDIDYKKYQNTDDYVATDEQMELLRIATEESIGLLRGSSGSGKSTAIKALIDMLEDNGLTYTLVAFTGVASKRMSQTTHRPASTIHRATCNDNIINTDYLICDEWSMTSVEINSMMMNAMGDRTKLILIADEAQFVAIGAGNCLKDVIDSGIVPMAILTKIFRYGLGSLTTVATDIRFGKVYMGLDGQPCYLNHGKDNDYEHISIDNDNPLDQVMSAYRKLLKKYSYKDIQVLSSYNVGSVGTYAINSAIQAEFNPLKKNQNQASYKRGVNEITFRVGDKILNCVNWYDALTLDAFETQKKMAKLATSDSEEDNLGYVKKEYKPVNIMNGDIGYIRDIDDKGNIIAQIDEELVVYTKPTISNLLLGYSISFIKSQGSQNKAIISVIHKSHSRYLSRAGIYVANTRCQEKLIEISDIKTVNDALDVVEIDNRKTFLKQLLLK